MRRFLLCVLGLTMLCGELPGKAGGQGEPRLPPDALPLPLVRQEQDYSCGVAALLSVLRFYGAWDGPEAELYAMLQTDVQEGTLPEAITAGAMRLGVHAELREPMTVADLRAALAANKPVILQLQAWRPPERMQTPWARIWEDGHFVVLLGMDADHAYVMDPSTPSQYAYLPIAELMERWHDINPIRPDPSAHKDAELGIVLSPTHSPLPPPPPLSFHSLVRLL